MSERCLCIEWLGIIQPTMKQSAPSYHHTKDEMKTQTCLCRTMAVPMCWIKLAYHNCCGAFIVSPKNIFDPNILIEPWPQFQAFCVFEFAGFQLNSFFAFSAEQFFLFFSFLVWRFLFFLEFDACGAMPIYFNGVDSFLRLKNWKREMKNQKNCPVEPVL